MRSISDSYEITANQLPSEQARAWTPVSTENKAGRNYFLCILKQNERWLSYVIMILNAHKYARNTHTHTHTTHTHIHIALKTTDRLLAQKYLQRRWEGLDQSYQGQTLAGLMAQDSPCSSSHHHLSRRHRAHHLLVSKRCRKLRTKRSLRAKEHASTQLLTARPCIGQTVR